MSSERVGRAGVIIATGTLTSRVLGLFKQVLLVYAIGSTGLAANAFATAQEIPNTIYTLIITGALTAVLVPQITKAALAEDGGQRYINKLVTLAIIGTAMVVPVMSAVTPWMVKLLGPDWGSQQSRLAVLFALWMMPQILFYSLYTVVGEVLNAKSVFGPYAWTPVLSNFINITGMGLFIVLYGSHADNALSLERWDPLAIALMAGSSTLGVAVQGLALFAFWRKAGLKFRFDFGFRGIGLGTMGRVAFWMFLTVLVAQLVSLVYVRVLNLAVTEDVAGRAAWNLVKVITIMPHSVIVIALVTANFTRMSASVHDGNIEQMKSYLVKAARITIVAMVLVISTISLLAMPISRILQIGVHHEVLLIIAPLLIIMMIGMLGHSLLFVFNRGFFSLSDTKRPFLISVVFSGVALFAAFGTSFMPVWLIAYTLALFDSLITFTQVIVTFLALRKVIGPMRGPQLIGVLLQSLAGVFVALIFGFGTLVLLGGVAEGAFPVSSFSGAFVTCALVFAVMAVIYALVLRLVKNPEVGQILEQLGRLTKRLRR